MTHNEYLQDVADKVNQAMQENGLSKHVCLSVKKTERDTSLLVMRLSLEEQENTPEHPWNPEKEIQFQPGLELYNGDPISVLAGQIWDKKNDFEESLENADNDISQRYTDEECTAIENLMVKASDTCEDIQAKAMLQVAEPINQALEEAGLSKNVSFSLDFIDPDYPVFNLQMSVGKEPEDQDRENFDFGCNSVRAAAKLIKVHADILERERPKNTYLTDLCKRVKEVCDIVKSSSSNKTEELHALRNTWKKEDQEKVKLECNTLLSCMEDAYQKSPKDVLQAMKSVVKEREAVNQKGTAR